MKELYTEIEINASASVVWDILTDFNNFPNWNPFIKEISGNLQEGSQIEVFITPPKNRSFQKNHRFFDAPKNQRFFEGFFGRAKIFDFCKPPNSNGMRFKPKILTCKPKEEIRWLGNLWIPKLFDGEHSLIIEKISENKILFIQKEKFSGLLVPFFSSLLEDTKSGFEMMNQALKREVEK